VSTQRSRERCALCDRVDVDEYWLWFELERMSPDVDCEFDTAELAFCSQAHAADYLGSRELTWPEFGVTGRRHQTRLDTFFFGCGLLAIVLSAVGVVALVLWLL
jgi:hypothetical protein